MSQPVEISCRELKARFDRGETVVLLDVREQSEYDTAHLAEAKLVPMSQITERLAELDADRNQEVVVHCHHGGRSLRVGRWLLSQGFSKVYNLTGGIDQWSVDVDPTIPRY